jgi:hypothetical protein
MSIDVSRLQIIPNSFRRGQRNAQILFTGLVGSLSDNNVRLTLMIEPDAPVYFLDANGNNVKVLRWSQQFGTTPDVFPKNVTVRVTTTPTQPESCSLRLEALDSKGYRSATNAFLIYS